MSYELVTSLFMLGVMLNKPLSLWPRPRQTPETIIAAVNIVEHVGIV